MIPVPLHRVESQSHSPPIVPSVDKLHELLKYKFFHLDNNITKFMVKPSVIEISIILVKSHEDYSRLVISPNVIYVS